MKLTIVKNRTKFLVIGIAAATLTAVLYLIDTDPPYEHFGKTLIEFSINCGVIFLLLTLVYIVAGRFTTKRRTE